MIKGNIFFGKFKRVADDGDDDDDDDSDDGGGGGCEKSPITETYFLSNFLLIQVDCVNNPSKSPSWQRFGD